MAKGTRPVRIEFTTGRIITRERKAMTKAFQQAVNEMTRALRKAISRQGPPRSKPGRYLKRDTGRLYDETRVMRKGYSIFIRTLAYGVFHQEGITYPKAGLQQRKFYKEKIFEQRRNWERRINALIRIYSKKG